MYIKKGIDVSQKRRLIIELTTSSIIILLSFAIALFTDVLIDFVTWIKNLDRWHVIAEAVLIFILLTLLFYTIRSGIYRLWHTKTANRIETYSAKPAKFENSPGPDPALKQCNVPNNEKFLYEFIDFLPVAIFIHQNRIITYANRTALKLFDASNPLQMLGKSIRNFIHPDYFEVMEKHNLSIEKGAKEVSVTEKKLIKLNGDTFDVEITSVPFNTASSKAILAVVYDITQRKQIEQTLRQSKARYKDLIEFLPDAVLIHNFNNIIFANRAAASMLGAEHFRQLLGKSLMNFIPQERRNAAYNYFREVFFHKKSIPLVKGKTTRSDGSIMDVEIAMNHITYGGQSAVMAVLRDITEREKAAELNQRLNEALKNDQIKTEFFTNVSHDLRTPLNLILGTLQMMELHGKNTNNANNIYDCSKYIKTIRQNCFRLLRLINNIIDMSKLDAGFYEMHIENRNIVAVVEEICQSVADYIKSKNIRFIFDTNVEEKIIAFDVDKLERILLNLFSNALKFTDPGGCISVNIQDETDKIRISISDTGIGIPREKLGEIFDRFRQVNQSLSRNPQGSGIGLSLVKSLVEMHGGTIYAQSQDGQGSEFIIELPAITTTEKPDVPVEKLYGQNWIEKVMVEFSDVYSQ